MRFLKLIVISFAVLFFAAVTFSFLFPSTLIVSRAININASKTTVINLIKDWKGWSNWMEGMSDSSVHILSPVEARLGNTTVHIIQVDTVSVHSLWKSNQGKMMQSDITLYGTDSALTVVHWQFVQKIKWYPWEKLASLLSDKILGPMMEKDLNALKQKAEHTGISIISN